MDERLHEAGAPRCTTWRATAGVSLATVDRVLNGRPGVRPETSLKVEDAIRPSISAATCLPRCWPAPAT